MAGGAGSLGGTVTATVSGGVATFTNLADDIAGTISIAFASGSLNPATADPTTVSPAAATQLVVTTQPPSSLTPARASRWSSPPRTPSATWTPPLTAT